MKLVKKAGTVAIASALLLTAAPQAWANDAAVGTQAIRLPIKGDDTAQLEPKITKDQALELARKYVAIPDGYTLQSANLNAYYVMNGHSIPNWNLSFVKKVKDQYLGDLHVTINGISGEMVGYSINDKDPEHKLSYPPKVDFKGAKAIASAWIGKVNPDKQKELLYNQTEEDSFRTPLNGNYQYNIRFDRAVNGIPFMENGVNVTVNGDGQVTGYNYNWDDDVTFETNVTPIGEDKIAQTFKDKADVTLAYQIPYEAKGEKKPLIAYTLVPFALNAVNGEVWNQGAFSQSLYASDNKPLTEQPLSGKPASNLNLTKEEAVKKVTDAFKLPDDYKLRDASYNEVTSPETGESSSSWNLNWSRPAAENDSTGKIGGSGAWAAVNSKTGEIMSFNKYINYPNDGTKPVDGKVALDTAKASVIDFVKKNLPAYTDQLVMSAPVEKNIPAEQLKQQRTWEFNFKRVIDGVSANYESVNVSIDRTDGAILNYYNSITNLPYPKQKPEVIALDKAKETLLSQYEIKLNYVVANSGAPGGIPIEKYRLMIAAGESVPSAPVGGDNKKLEAKLVYSLIPKFTREQFFLNAQTGQWVNASNGEVISLERVKVDDIENHWAKNELQLMLDYQALDVKDGKVNPDQAITRGELIKMLVIAMNGGNSGIYYPAARAASFADVQSTSKYFAYVENAVDRGLLVPGEDFNPEAKITREDMAQLIVKALGYKSLTKYENVFNKNFADAAKLKNIGEAAIVVGLDIMSLNNGSFEPGQEVTKAQAAVAFSRYLQKRADLQDQRPRYVY